MRLPVVSRGAAALRGICPGRVSPHGSWLPGNLSYRHESTPCSYRTPSLVRRRRILLWRPSDWRQWTRIGAADLSRHLSFRRLPHQRLTRAFRRLALSNSNRDLFPQLAMNVGGSQIGPSQDEDNQLSSGFTPRVSSVYALFWGTLTKSEFRPIQMNDVISTAKVDGTRPGGGSRSYSVSLHRDLLVAHEELLVQLRTELACHSGVESSSRKLRAMIAQHERAAATLREQVRPHASRAARVKPVPRESNSRRINRVSERT